MACSTNLADEIIVLEDEKKFREYFLQEKKKSYKREQFSYVDYGEKLKIDIELALNKELIEQQQENIIEQEEWVPAYPTPEEKYIKNKKSRQKYDGKHKYRVSGWLKNGIIPIGLKGGSDRPCKKRKGKENFSNYK